MPAHDSAVPERSTRTVSRRTVVAGAAWAVPAVLVASAAPAAAASGGIDLAPALRFRYTSTGGPIGPIGVPTMLTGLLYIYNVSPYPSVGPVMLTISKDPHLSDYAFDPSQSPGWFFDFTSNPDYVLATYTGVVSPSPGMAIGRYTFLFTPPTTGPGAIDITTTLVPGSGGDTDTTNNTSKAQIPYGQ